MRFFSFFQKFGFAFFAFLLIQVPVQGQTYFQNTLYDFHRMVYNPGAVGLTNQGKATDWTFNFLGRTQWVGIDQAPNLGMVTAQKSIEGVGALGVSAFRDGIGPLSNTGLRVSYAYPFNVGQNGILQLGTSIGFSQRAISFQVKAVEDDILFGAKDATIGQSVGAFDLSVGGFYQGLKDGFEQYFLGVGIQDLLEPSLEALTLDPVRSVNSVVPRSFYVTAGYRIPMGTWTGLSYNYIQPSIMLRNQGNITQLDGTVMARYNGFYGGVNYRGAALFGQNNESIGGILGLDINPQMFFGYSFDYNLSSLNINGGATSHELSFTYRLGGKGGSSNGRPKDGTPIKQ